MNAHVLYPCLAAVLALGTACGGRTSLDDFGGTRPPAIPDFDGTSPSNSDGTSADAGAEDDGDAGEDASNADVVFTGAGCDRDSDCDGGDEVECLESVSLAGTTLELPSGYCAVEDCQNDSACGAEAVCLDVLGDNFCALECEDDADCREDDGYACTELAASGSDNTFCLPTAETADEPTDINPACQFFCDGDDDELLLACSVAMENGDDLPDGCGFGGGGGGGGDNGGGFFGN